MRLHTDPSICSGCRSCEVVCSLKHERMIHPLAARLRILKHEERGEDIPVVCLQCEDAPCAAACPVDCIRRDSQTGAWLVHDQECTGCQLCAAACQRQVIRIHPQRDVAFKCDLCGGAPECAAVCQLHALRLEDATLDAGFRKEPT